MTRRRSPIATLREWLSRLWGALRPSRGDDDLRQELQLHQDLAAEDARRSISSPESAARTARIAAGGVAQAIEALRDQRGLPWTIDLVRDLRYGCRVLAKNPSFTTVAVLSLAVGIGANCAVFSFADALLLRPLTVPQPGEVLTVGLTDAFTGALVASYREYLDIRDRSRSFAGLAAFTPATAGLATDPGAPPKLTSGMLVSGNFLRVMRVEPRLGRDFLPEEDAVPGRNAVAILGHDLWTEQFGADRSVLGRTLRLNGIDFTIVGVAPEGFNGLSQFVRQQFYVPLMMWSRLMADSTARPFEARDFRKLVIAGRLNPRVTISQAQAELSVVAADLERAHPEFNRNQRIVVRTELQNRIAAAPPVVVLLAMLTMLAGAVLLVACANVSGLLASRAPVRAREIALRLAIGAGRPRVIRQLVTESLLIAAAGAVAGLGVGYAGVSLFRKIQIPTDLPIVLNFELDRRVLLVSLVVGLASTLVFGLAPAIRSTRTDLIAVMKANDSAALVRGRRVGRPVLVGAQVAISVVLLVVAAYIYRGFRQQIASGPGFRTDQLLMMNVDPTPLGYSHPQARRFFEQLADRARQVPGIMSAALTRYMPMDGGPPSVTIVPEGFHFPSGKESVAHAGSGVDEHFFDTIGLPILEGRGFRETDSDDAPRVVVVNGVLAERYWPGQSPIGKRLRLDDRGGDWAEIVGVAKTSKYAFAIEAPMAFVYLPFRQRPAEGMFLLVRHQGDVSNVASRLRELVHSLDPNLPVANIRSMEELYRMRALDVLGVVTTIIGAMGIMGLALAVVGLYGLVAFAVSRRTKEIGIRMAIGAGRNDVLRMVLGQGLALAAGGLAVGLVASAGAGRALAAAFPGGPHGDGRTDVVAFLAVAATVLAVTVLATYVPARRASRINPTLALRCE